MPAILLAASVHEFSRIAHDLQQLLDQLVDLHNVRDRPRLAQAFMRLKVGVLKPGDELPSGELWEGDRCPLCYDDYESGQSVVVLRCDHVICLDCCIRGLAAKPMLRTCGMCREAIFESEVDLQVLEEEAGLLGNADDYYSDYGSQYDEWSGERDYPEDLSDDDDRSEDDLARPVMVGGEVMTTTANTGHGSGNRSDPIVFAEDSHSGFATAEDASADQAARLERGASTDYEGFEDVVYGPNRRRMPLQILHSDDGIPRHQRRSQIGSPVRPRSPTLPAASARHFLFGPSSDYGSLEYHPSRLQGERSRERANESFNPFDRSPSWYPTSPKCGSDGNDDGLEFGEESRFDTGPSGFDSTPISNGTLSADDWSRLSLDDNRNMLSDSHEDNFDETGRKRVHQRDEEAPEGEEDVVYAPKRRRIMFQGHAGSISMSSTHVSI